MYIVSTDITRQTAWICKMQKGPTWTTAVWPLTTYNW